MAMSLALSSIRLDSSTNRTPATPTYVLQEDNTSFILLEDGTSNILKES